MSDSAAVRFSGVSKRYPFFALEDVSFRLEHGQIMGFVGPNGAGKTTSIRIALSLLCQDSGEVEVLGCPMPAEQVRAKWNVGYVADDMNLFGTATLGWHMTFVRSIYPAWDDAYAVSLLQRFGLRAEQPIRGLSHGERIKAILLLVLARRPRLLILDEPGAGLDPVARQEVLVELMDVLRNDERSILLSSHNTAEVERIADQITFIDRGRIVESRDKEVFLERWRRLLLDVHEGVDLPPVPGVVDVERVGNSARVTLNAWRPDLATAFTQAGMHVREERRMTLEEIFVATVMHSRKERES